MIIKVSPRSMRNAKPSALAFRHVVKKEATRKSPDFKSWFDMWHRHIDWEGDGILSRQHRTFELWALFKTLHRFEHETRHMRERCQVFVYVNEHTPGNDAVYVHTPNPNGTPFPYVPQVDRWLTATPVWLARHVCLERYVLGVRTSDGERYYFVQRKL
jgi:hypothetical protein